MSNRALAPFDRKADVNPMPELVSATVAEDATSATEPVHVIVPSMDPTQQLGIEAYFMPRTERLPKRGDPCAIQIDETGRPWIVGWIPVG